MQRDSCIHEYSYKPDPIFYGSVNRYFGVELEIDYAGENGKNACQILRRANQGQELAYCKHDGSLEDGFEIVTHPMTLNYHQKSMSWAKLLQEAISLGYSEPNELQTAGATYLAATVPDLERLCTELI